MVKPELKAGDSMKPPLLPSTSKTSLESEGNAAKDLPDKKLANSEAEAGLVVQFDEQNSRMKSPRICLFVGLFVLILLVGFLAVYLIGRTHGNSPEAKKANMADDIATVPQGNTSAIWKQNVSWETKEELFQLSDAIGSADDIIGLRPIYRKDLPPAYIAYWELKLNGKTGEKYVVISAAKETGDHRLAEEGPIPSPIDIMSDQAERLGYRCHRVYRLTPGGLMVCEDRSLRRIVAATNDIVNTKSMFYSIKWRKLDKQVAAALPRYKKDWQDLSKRVRKLPEWTRFKWLSMKSGKWPTTEPPKLTSTSWEGRHIHTHDVVKQQGKKWHRHHSHRDKDDDHDHDGDNDDGGDDSETELGLRPGQSVKLPVGRGFHEVRIRFSGLGKMMRHHNRKAWNKWQRRLCRVLCDACEGSDYTRVKRKYIKKTKMGDRYIKLRIESDSRYVRRQLQGQEVRFKIELSTGRQKVVVVNYGIVLRSSRRGRSVGVDKYSVPHPELFPDYKERYHGRCMAGSGSVAWAMVLGYYSKLAERYPNDGTWRDVLKLVSDSHAPLTTSKQDQRILHSIASKLKAHCNISPAKMTHIGKSVEKISNSTYTLVTESDKTTKQRATAQAIELLKSRIPVVFSKERGDSGEHHYAVATRLRQRRRRYRVCAQECSPWSEDVTSEIFVHPGAGKVWNKWESADTHFIVALVKKET